MSLTLEEYFEKEKINEITELCSHQENGFAKKKAETFLKYLNPINQCNDRDVWISDNYLNDIILSQHINYSKDNSSPYFQITSLSKELAYLDESHHSNLVEKIKNITKKYQEKVKEENDKLSKMSEGEICEYYQELTEKYQHNNQKKDIMNDYDNDYDNDNDND